jgi:transaldolase
MTKPHNLKTKIFLDSGDPKETKEIIELLGFLDGQTTNPTLISKNPEVQKRLVKGIKFSKEEIYDFYRQVVKEISALLPKGSVSVEVYADRDTSSEEMFILGKEMFSWIPNAHIKYPTTLAGLEAAELSIKEKMRVNMTLVFTQEQAAAVYAATRGAKKGDVFVSPFIGRLDDIGINGMDLVKNILLLYKDGDGHVEVLAASIRSLDHLLAAIALKCDIVTAPAKILKEWANKGMLIPDNTYKYSQGDLKNIPLKKLNLSTDWRVININHKLTDKGIDRFTQDWNNLVVK